MGYPISVRIKYSSPSSIQQRANRQPPRRQHCTMQTEPLSIRRTWCTISPVHNLRLPVSSAYTCLLTQINFQLTHWHYFLLSFSNTEHILPGKVCQILWRYGAPRWLHQNCWRSWIRLSVSIPPSEVGWGAVLLLKGAIFRISRNYWQDQLSFTRDKLHGIEWEAG